MVGRLGDLLAHRFGADKVFVDVDSIPAGVDFAEEIERELSTCAVLLVIIGPGWLSAADARGRRRLDDPDDFVVLEVQTALDRNVRVIPVLVDGALMPRRDELPAELANFARRHAIRLDHDTFRSDVSGLLTQLDTILNPTIQTPRQDVALSPVPARSSSNGQLTLDDDHSVWNRHTGLLGHDGPEWDFPADIHHAEAFYRPVTGKAKTFLDLRIEHPGTLLDVNEICGLADGVFTGSRSVAGSLSGLVRPHEASGRRYPFYWWAGNPTRYGKKPSVAALFAQARRNLAR